MAEGERSHYPLLMRRSFPVPSFEKSIADFEAMLRGQEGLRMLLPHLHPGATMEDARRLYERLNQVDRRPCSFLDQDLGIQRD